MATKFPVTDNSVTTSRRTRRRGLRGIALVSVVSVLVLLMIVATPFLLSMRDSARRGENWLYTVRAEAEAESLFEQIEAWLVAGVEHLERRSLDALGPGGGASGATRPPDDATPGSDTLSELQLPAEMLREFNHVVGREHRVWDVEIRDAQAKFNLNSCGVGILANLLGRSELAETIEDGDDKIQLADVSAFPEKDGVVRIGAEVVRYQKADLASRSLLGCRRGYLGDRPENGAAQKHEKGTLVIHEAAFQLATRPFRALEGRWSRYTNVYQARAVSEMGVTALLPDEFDRIRRYVTAWNGNVVGDGWCNPQVVRNNITAGDQSQLYATVKSLRYYGPGTLVRITDGVNEDYAVVISVEGANKVNLAGTIRHDYLPDQTRIYSLARAALNVNTADVDTLALVFDGLGLDGQSERISRQTAFLLAQFLRSRPNPLGENDKNPEVGIYRNWQDFVKALEEAKSERGILKDYEFESVLRNCMNACDSRLAFSTVPITFRSFDVYEARATAAMMGLQGQELARRELTRVFEVSSGRSATCVLETQAEFQDQVRISRDAKWFVTYPVNVNAYYDGDKAGNVNEPASEYHAYADKSRFPDNDRAAGAGHLQLRTAAFRIGAQDDRYFHFDEQDDPDGLDLEKQSFELSPEAPYNRDERKVALTRFIDVPQRSDQADLGLAPFACSFWYQPKWRLDNAEHVIFDYGVGEAFMNRVTLRFDPQRRALVLAVADATREQLACEVEYTFSDDKVQWTQDAERETWFHIACTVYGCSPEMMELFVDGEQIGRTPLLTRLRNSIPPTGVINTVDVDDASGFPESGVLLLRSPDGVEYIEYSSRGDNNFSVTRRKARNIDVVLDQTNEVRRGHVAGEVVQLYGYSSPLLTDVKRGGASLQSSLGPWRVYRAIGTDTANSSTGIAYFQGYQNQISLTEWETGNVSDNSTLDDLGAAGAEGIAALVTTGFWIFDPDANGTPNPLPVNGNGQSGTNDGILGGLDVVRYRVDAVDTTGVKVTLLDRGLVLRHWDASTWVTQAPNGGRFFPSYDYGNTASPHNPVTDPSTGQPVPHRGAMTAFVPIGLIAQGASSDYLDPVDKEPQLLPIPSGGGSLPSSAYIQVDSEWIKYDTFDATSFSGRVAFYRDVDTNLNGQDGLPAIQNLFAVGSAGTAIAPFISPTVLVGGGQGQVGTNDPPPPAVDDNVESDPPPVPAAGGGGGGNLQPPHAYWGTDKIAAALDFRSWEDRSTNRIHRIANTIARDHTAGTPIIPCFAVWGIDEFDTSAAGRGICPGFNDLVTLRDTRGSDEQIRVQWGYKTPLPAGQLIDLTRRAAWLAPTQTQFQTWNWDRPMDVLDLARFPAQAWTRIVKFPSREMPDFQLTQSDSRLRFGKKFDDSGGTTPAKIDEVVFHELQFPEAQDRRDFAYLGPVPSVVYTAPTAGTTVSTTTNPVKYIGIDDKAEDISVFMNYYDPAVRAYILNGLPIAPEVYRADGGMIRIDDELILYSSFDAGTGEFKGCVRGVFPTKAADHDYGAMVVPVESFAFSRLQDDANATAASFNLVDATDFPREGCLRIGDGLEIVGYTEKLGNQLTGPVGRIDPGTDTGRPQTGNRDAEKRAGGALFRGRFASNPLSYGAGDVAMAMPFRHYDRYAERSDDPENSYAQFSWTKDGAVWKRVTWDELLPKNVEVLALVRFSGGPEWDSDRIVKVGQQELPKENRRGWLYEISDPAAENLLNVEADRVEVRLMVRFARGAYDREATPRPNEWKETPWIQRVLVEYVAPSAVLSQE